MDLISFQSINKTNNIDKSKTISAKDFSKAATVNQSVVDLGYIVCIIVNQTSNLTKQCEKDPNNIPRHSSYTLWLKKGFTKIDRCRC